MAAPVMSKSLKNCLRDMRQRDAAKATRQQFFDQTNAMAIREEQDDDDDQYEDLSYLYDTTEPEWTDEQRKERRQFMIDFCFSDAPEEMKKELGVRPLNFVNQDGKPLSSGDGVGLFELGRRAAQRVNQAAMKALGIE